MNRLDERLRGFCLSPCGRDGLLYAALSVVLFFVLLWRTSLLPAGVGSRLAEAALFTLPFAALAGVALSVAARGRHSRAALLLMLAGALFGMLARLTFVRHVSPDFENYLAGWMGELSRLSFPEAMRRQIGEYNVLYQYLLFGAARLPVPALSAVKAVSFLGDALLCGGMARLAGSRRAPAAFFASLLLPTVLLNGAMFAQCDSLYAACAVWGLALALEGRPARSACCFALSLAFKLQALFLFPVLPVLWADGKLRFRDIGAFALTLLVCALPALLGGKSPAAIVSYYTGQTGLYTGLTYNAPTLFGLMETGGLDVYAYGRFGVLLALGAAALAAASGVGRAGKLPDAETVRLSLVTVLCVVFLLPRMHERYFYLAVCLAAVMAVRARRFFVPFALLELASLSRLWEMGIPLRAASAMVFAALVLTVLPERRAGTGDNPV